MPVTQQIIKSISNSNEILFNALSPLISKDKLGAITIGAAVVLTLTYLLVQKVNKPSSKLKQFPYVSFFSFIKYSMIKDELYENYSKDLVMPLFKNGKTEIYARPSATGWFLQTSNPMIIKQFLFKQESLFPKVKIDLPEGTLTQRFIGGPSIVALTGADWKRHRKIANPAFQRSMPVLTFGKLTKKLFSVIEGSDNTADVLDLFERWTLDAIGIAGFDFDFNALGNKDSEWVHYYDTIKRGMGNPLFIFFSKFDTTYLHMFKKRKQLHENLDRFLANIDSVIERKRKIVLENKENDIQEEEKDLLTLMIESEIREDGAKLSNEELRSNLIMFFLAGHDTTANALAAAVYELAIHPELQEKARAEAIRILGESPEDVIPTFEQTKQMDYINMVIKETLRRHPPAYGMAGRLCQEDIELGGILIPKGVQLSVDIYNLHHNPNVWKDPYTFNPERFARGGEADNQQGIAWVPFSNGSRQCIGMNFSLTEQRVLLSMMLRKYKWTLPSDSPHKERFLKRGIAWGLIITSDPLNINFEKRY